MIVILKGFSRDYLQWRAHGSMGERVRVSINDENINENGSNLITFIYRIFCKSLSFVLWWNVHLQNNLKISCERESLGLSAY